MDMSKARGICVFALLLAAGGAAHTQPNPTGITWRDLTPGSWHWLDDYVFLKAEYVVGCPRDRKCRVGTGIFIAGEPRGDEKDFSGDLLVTVLGAGALHVKVLDGSTPARIGFYRKDQTLIPIY